MPFMPFDKELVSEILHQIYDALKIVQKRCAFAKTADDFLDSEEGQEKLDGICMKLIAVGESLKNIDKITHKDLLYRYPHIEWKLIMGIRDVLSHHYFDVDANTIFDVCNENIGELLTTIGSMIEDLERID